MLVPIVDLLLRSSPPQFGTLQWRFATAGLLFGNYGTIILGMALLGLAAALSGDRGVLRAVGIASLVMLVVTLAGIVLFLLDAVQIRRLATANFKRPILTSSLGALFTATLGAVGWLSMGRAALAASRPARAAARGRPAAPAPLMTGGAVPVGAGSQAAGEAV
jgi:hypothetical protein